ncbi:transcriptional regulator [Caldisphaera lagunensis DSM 15908]|uniref:Transcriptional regulator n=1 Tax=Caldisphaera lagunensis (strain DSM 15908 / JCM 11604 / ANMR 0165 / IC-154) TaxID=1056495 RepID=L0AB88_CALLD|nr:Lrp/AsnC family transcriptional regulator [Caldisphaera lagunensis]AFZ70407.1 transcriptional regulator [Caldisphaera lagunensis DSM 15908]
MKQKTIDDKDILIIKNLEKDSRKPWRQLANELNLSEATIYLRIKKLEENEIIKGFTVKVDPLKIGLAMTVFLLIKVRAENLIQVKKELVRLDYIVELHEITGSYQFLAKLYAPSQREASKAIEEIMKIEGIVEVNTLISLSSLKSEENVIDALGYWLNSKG